MQAVRDVGASSITEKKGTNGIKEAPHHELRTPGKDDSRDRGERSSGVRPQKKLEIFLGKANLSKYVCYITCAHSRS